MRVKLEDLDLDDECWKCRGEGCARNDFGDPDGECDICDGVGYTTNANGDELIKFIARHWKEIKRLRGK